MRTLVAFATLGGLIWCGASYATGHWIAGTFLFCACGYLVTTQAPDTPDTTPENTDNVD